MIPIKPIYKNYTFESYNCLSNLLALYYKAIHTSKKIEMWWKHFFNQLQHNKAAQNGYFEGRQQQTKHDCDDNINKNVSSNTFLAVLS